MALDTIRPATRDDGAAIRHINASGQPGVSPLSADELEAITTGVTRCWVAVDSERGVVGYLIAYREHDAYDGEEFAWFQRRYRAFLYVDQIAVDAQTRRQGVGERLYQAAIANARDLESLVCEVNLEPPIPGHCVFTSGWASKRWASFRHTTGESFGSCACRSPVGLASRRGV